MPPPQRKPAPAPGASRALGGRGPRHGLKVATFNVNSIRRRLLVVLDWLEKERPDVLALQETKVTDELFPRNPFEERGWHVWTRGQKGYNGVALVSREPLQSPLRRFGPKDPPDEARFVAGELDGVLFVNTYVPQGHLIDSPKYQWKLEYFAALREWFERNVPPSRPALWMGDLNVARTELDVDNPATKRDHVCFHADARAAFEACLKGIWIDLFREKVKEGGHYTFWDYRFPSSFETNKGWRIDYLLGTPPMAARLRRVWIDKAPRAGKNPSDHTVLAAEFDP